MNDYGILSGNRILEEVEKGAIVIDPFDKKFLNPNSYNLHLADELLTYDHSILDMKKEEPYTIERISPMALFRCWKAEVQSVGSGYLFTQRRALAITDSKATGLWNLAVCSL